MNKALEDDDIKSMIALINYDGVGMKTMEGCFKMVMNYKKNKHCYKDGPARLQSC